MADLFLCLGEFNEKIRDTGLLTRKTLLIPEKTVLRAANFALIEIIVVGIRRFLRPHPLRFLPFPDLFLLSLHFFSIKMSPSTPVFERHGRGLKAKAVENRLCLVLLSGPASLASWSKVRAIKLV